MGDDNMQVAELCFHLKKRRKMYLLEDRYPSVVAFVEGYNAALDGRPLAGFQQWVSERILGKPSNIHWSYIIASTVLPHFSLKDGLFPPIAEELNDEIVDTLADLMLEFCGD